MPPSVELDLPFETNAVIDFNQLAESKYGFEVMHPTVATADDLLVDDDAEDDGENEDDDERDEQPPQSALQAALATNPIPPDLNADPLNDTPNAAPAANQGGPTPAPTKKRGRMVGKYDLHDPFIDDAEMEWESTAAATKDGFFVYSGVFEEEDTSTDKDGKKSAKRKKDKDNADTNTNAKRRKPQPKKKIPGKAASIEPSRQGSVEEVETKEKEPGKEKSVNGEKKEEIKEEGTDETKEEKKDEKKDEGVNEA